MDGPQHPIRSMWRTLLRRGVFRSGTRLGRLVRAIHTPFDAFERTSDAVARGNLKVFDEIGRAFARWLSSCRRDTPVDDPAFTAFLADADARRTAGRTGLSAPGVHLLPATDIRDERRDAGGTARTRQSADRAARTDAAAAGHSRVARRTAGDGSRFADTSRARALRWVLAHARQPHRVTCAGGRDAVPALRRTSVTRSHHRLSDGARSAGRRRAPVGPAIGIPDSCAAADAVTPRLRGVAHALRALHRLTAPSTPRTGQTSISECTSSCISSAHSASARTCSRHRSLTIRSRGS